MITLMKPLNILKLMYYKYNSLHLTEGDVGYILQLDRWWST